MKAKEQTAMYHSSLNLLNVKPCLRGVESGPEKVEERPSSQSQELKDENSACGERRRHSKETDVRNELKNAIQSKRLAQGLHALELPTTSTAISSEKLSPAEEERRRLRRERNKIAASKCRERKRIKTEQLNKEAKELQMRNFELESDIKKLCLERDSLLQKLQNHSCVLSTSPSCVTIKK